MNTGTLPSPAPEQHLPPQHDPWGAAVEGAPLDAAGRIQLSDAEVRARYEEIMSRYADPEPAQEPVAGNVPDARREHIPTTTPEEIARREQASLMATYALAHTLRESQPQLMDDLVNARPADYQPRHRAPQANKSYRGRHRR